LYKKGVYFLRPKIKSFKSKKSSHIQNAKRIYNVSEISPSKKLSNATGCSINALNKIVKKGEGAYYSSGSRPNQTPQSWGYARLASSLTAGKAAAVDFNIIDKGCNHNKLAYKLAVRSRKRYKYGHSSSKKTKFIYNDT
jgi:DNA-binding Xre family transcriptional regulator